MKEKLISLAADRSSHLAAAENALKANDREAYETEMAAIDKLNDEMAPIQKLLKEQESSVTECTDSASANETKVKDMVDALKHGKQIAMDNADVMRALNSTLIGTDSLAKPTQVGTNIHDTNNVVSAVIDNVTVMDLQGCAQWDEPYVKTESSADVGADGSAPASPSDPVFRVASVKPTLVETLAYVSRHIENLTPANYLAKVQELALKALRRKIVALITNGDNSTFYGLTNATNTKSEAIYKTKEVSSATISATFLRDLVLGAGGSETTGAGFLLLKKADLIALGDIRGTNEKRPVYEITPDPMTNGNTGTIKDGGLLVNYILDDSLTALSTATQGQTAIKTMVYVDLSTYILGLFGNYKVEVSKDYKFAEGLLAVRGEVMAGGNLCVHESCTVVTLAAASQAGVTG